MIFKHCLLSLIVVVAVSPSLVAQDPPKVPAKGAEYERAKNTRISRLELNDSTIAEAARLVSEITSVNIVATAVSYTHLTLPTKA